MARGVPAGGVPAGDGAAGGGAARPARGLHGHGLGGHAGARRDADPIAGGAVPADVMAPTRRDATAVLLLWVLRRCFYPLLLVGLAFAWIAGEVTPVALVRLENPLQLVGALFTPLAGIAVALGVRVVVDLVALAVAFPRTRWVSEEDVEVDEAGHRRGPVRRWVDRLYMTAAYRELRSTWTVRGRATSQLGRSGRWLTWFNVGLWAITALAGAMFVWAVVATPDLVWLAPGD